MENFNTDPITTEIKTKHPNSIIISCRYLGLTLPSNANVKYQPSFYFIKDKLDGKLKTINTLLKDKITNITSEELKNEFKKFKNYFITQECLFFNETDLLIYFTDYILFAYPIGFKCSDYFDFELYNKELNERETFIDNNFKSTLLKFNDEDKRKFFYKKHLFNKKFKKFIFREWIYANQSTFEEFAKFLDKNELFIAKPVTSSGGKGIELIERDSDTYENLYEKCRENNLLLEEYIVQHNEIAKINASTLNTVRILTFVDDNKKVHVIAAVAYFGRKNAIVDCFQAGGVVSKINIKTGKISSKTINKAHVKTILHPDTKIKIKGFTYPCWEEIIKTVKKAALVVPEVRHVAWDLAVNEDGIVDLIEGNTKFSFDTFQAPDQKGKKDIYKSILSFDDTKKQIYNFDLEINENESIHLDEIRISEITESKTGKPKFSWEPVDGANRYYIYRSTSKKECFRWFHGTEKNTFVNVSAEKGKKYYYIVIAINTVNQVAVSLPSEEITILCKK